MTGISAGKTWSRIGAEVAPTSSAASGVWQIGEVAENVGAGTWPAPIVGHIDLIEKQEGSAAVPSVTFNAIPQNYKHLRLVCQVDTSSSGSNLTMYYGTGGGAVDSNWQNYQTTSWSSTNSSGSSTSIQNYRAPYTTDYFYAFGVMVWPMASGDVYGQAIFDFPNYTSGLYKLMTGEGNSFISPVTSSTGRGIQRSGYSWDNTGAIDQIQIQNNAGNYTDYYCFKLYGIER